MSKRPEPFIAILHTDEEGNAILMTEAEHDRVHHKTGEWFIDPQWELWGDTDPSEIQAIVIHIERVISDVLHMDETHPTHPRREAVLQALGFARFALQWDPTDEVRTEALKRHLDNAMRYL